MSKMTVVNHIKGQKHTGKSNWSKVLSTGAPPTDFENPELLKNPKIKFEKVKKS